MTRATANTTTPKFAERKEQLWELARRHFLKKHTYLLCEMTKTLKPVLMTSDGGGDEGVVW
ncbi:hypothetical protein Dda_0136 [Drechslerella dactyloides]|uniref:Uncharacterized protein n=1 Tax=Drechslerella dactyloides TaxID=74499 RepID=A0AAD6J7K7_DREDA|nr:hypothetical protein Dda_0136 [Drechslerella dactyloides]